MIVAHVWTAPPSSAGFSERYWLEDEPTYHRANLELAKLGVTPVTLVVAEVESSGQRDGLAYRFVPVDDPSAPARAHTSAALRSALHELGPDVVVVHLLNRALTLAALRWTTGLRVLHVNTYHLDGSTFDALREEPGLVDLIVTTAPSLAAAIRERGVAAPVVVLPSAVDATRFAARPNVQPEWDLVWAGQLRRGDDKRPELLAEVARRARARLLIVGTGERQTELAPAAGPDVCFAGALPHRQMPSAYRSARVFLLTSSQDPAPRAVSEALACGLPVVAPADCRGLEDQVVHGETGLLGRSPDELAAHCRRLLDDPALRARLGRQGRRRVRSRFDPARRAARYVDLLRSTPRSVG